MSLWEFAACMDGFATFHGGKPKSGDLTPDDLRAMGVVGFDDE